MIYRGTCQRACEGECTCRHWLSAWGRNQALNIEQLISTTDQQTSAFSLEQTGKLEHGNVGCGRTISMMTLSRCRVLMLTFGIFLINHTNDRLSATAQSGDCIYHFGFTTEPIAVFTPFGTIFRCGYFAL